MIGNDHQRGTGVGGVGDGDGVRDLGGVRPEGLSIVETRTVVLMRHARSGHPGGVRDHDRPLTEPSQAAAAGAGTWLRSHLDPIDEILCSTALRAQQTALATGTVARLRSESDLYDATADDILQVLRTVDEPVKVLLVVGHAPGVPALAAQLTAADSGRGPADGNDGADELLVHFPTAALAVLQFAGEWSALDEGSARLLHFRLPPG